MESGRRSQLAQFFNFLRVFRSLKSGKFSGGYHASFSAPFSSLNQAAEKQVLSTVFCRSFLFPLFSAQTSRGLGMLNKSLTHRSGELILDFGLY